MREQYCDIAIIGSGCGGGTVAERLSSLCREGKRIIVFEKGPKLGNDEFTGKELEMVRTLYEAGGGFLTKECTMTLAFGSVYGGSTVVYTGTSILPSPRVLEKWNVPGIAYNDIARRAKRYMAENNVHYLEPQLINDNNRLFEEGCRRLNYQVKQFPLNVKNCRGSGFCNLGCPNQAKQGTDKAQLPKAEANGVEVITRAQVTQIKNQELLVRVSTRPPQGKGEPSSWPPGDYRVRTKVVVVSAGAVNTPALLLRSNFQTELRYLGHGFTCHPAFIVVAEQNRPITNFIGHPKSFYLDQFVESDSFILETCMYFPIVTAKSLTGFGQSHSSFMRSFDRLQMILVLACDEINPHNRVTIDKKGDPVVSYRFTPKVVHGLTAGAIASAKIFFAAGAKRVHLPVASPPVIEAENANNLDRIASEQNFRLGKIAIAAAHLQGGCAMGESSTNSVTDAWGQVHGYPWLFVADASLFPKSIEINPYLTIMAISDRVAEKIQENARRLL